MKLVPEEYYRFLTPLQQVDFVLMELTLYLDTHPHDHHALQQYREMVHHRDLLRQQFEAHFGPLCPTAPPGERWSWGAGPWPWQV